MHIKLYSRIYRVKCNIVVNENGWKLKTHIYFQERNVFLWDLDAHWSSALTKCSQKGVSVVNYTKTVMIRGTCTSSVRSMAVSVNTSSPHFLLDICLDWTYKYFWVYIFDISFSILSMWRWLCHWHLFLWDLCFGGEIPTKHDLAVLLHTALYWNMTSPSWSNIFKIASDGRVGDPGKWGFSCVQGGHIQCRPIIRRPAYEGMCAQLGYV